MNIKIGNLFPSVACKVVFADLLWVKPIPFSASWRHYAKKIVYNLNFRDSVYLWLHLQISVVYSLWFFCIKFIFKHLLLLYVYENKVFFWLQMCTWLDDQITGVINKVKPLLSSSGWQWWIMYQQYLFSALLKIPSIAKVPVFASLIFTVASSCSS